MSFSASDEINTLPRLQTSQRTPWLYVLQQSCMWQKGSELQADGAEQEDEEQQSRLNQWLRSRTAQVRTQTGHLASRRPPCVCDSCVSCRLQLDVEIETLTVQLSETSAAPGQKHHHILRDNGNGK